MRVLLIGQGESQEGAPVIGGYGNLGPPLTDEAYQRAQDLGERLRTNEVSSCERIATSGTSSSFITAVALGANRIRPYELLEEVPTRASLAELRRPLAGGDIPSEAIEAGQRVLDDPPPIDTWIVPPLLTAGIIGAILQGRPLPTHGFSLVKPLDIRLLDLEKMKISKLIWPIRNVPEGGS